MLKAIRSRDQKRVLAIDVARDDAPFHCPNCREDVVIKKGRIVTHHFAHAPPVTCSWGTGESPEHMRAKLEIFNALRTKSNVSLVEVEHELDDNRPDVYAVINGQRVAFEIQISRLDLADVARRTASYHSKNISVLWLALYSSELHSDRYSPKAWERWLHAAYFGRVYYWRDPKVIPVHFSDYSTHVPTKTFWKDGWEHTAGGYNRISKRWRTPELGAEVEIHRDFVSSVLKPFSGGFVEAPLRTVFIDKQQIWWQPKQKRQ